MSDDIVERLRERVADEFGGTRVDRIGTDITEAIEEIERLRSSLLELVDTFGAVHVVARVPEDRDVMVAVFAAFRRAMDALGR